MAKLLINSRPSPITTKIQTPHRTTVEQVYLKRLKETEAFIPKEEFISKQENINKVVETQFIKPLQYYSHINEIRSVKEFIYLSEKLKQKNIEKKMNERLELRGKLNKIKEIEVLKKLHYYLEKKIRLFIKDRQHDENPQAKTFDAFLQSHKEDKRIMQFPQDVQKELFLKLNAQNDSIPTKSKIPSPKSATHQKRNTQLDLFNSELSENVNQDEKEVGTSKFLTMKVANKLLGMMMVESSKGKRQPIIWAMDKKKELEEILNKPYGGKMNFNVHSFNWLIDNALNRTQSLVNLHKRSINRISTMDERIEYDEQLQPQDHQTIQKKINEGLRQITKTFNSRPKSSQVIKQRKELKNRRVITTEYNITERIKENVLSQAIRNQNVQAQQKTDSMFFQNDSYVNHYI